MNEYKCWHARGVMVLIFAMRYANTDEGALLVERPDMDIAPHEVDFIAGIAFARRFVIHLMHDAN
jgi:hypothetical protein